MLLEETFLAQQKMDGERRIVISDGKIIGLNKKGTEVQLPNSIIESIGDRKLILDGEIIGTRLFVFDILSLDGIDLKNTHCIGRIEILKSLSFGEGIKVINTAITPEEKEELFNSLKSGNQEGIVFKKKNSPYKHGRPASGGDQLKFKFQKTATFIVSDITKGKRSVGL